MTIFAIAAAGLLALFLQSYHITTEARCVDQARAALRSVGGEFMLGDDAGADLFAPTSSPTGAGLTLEGRTGDRQGLRITLGNGLPAVLTREVVQVGGATGEPLSGVSDDLAGRVVQATFSLRYTYQGRPQEERLTLLRALP